MMTVLRGIYQMIAGKAVFKTFRPNLTEQTSQDFVSVRSIFLLYRPKVVSETVVIFPEILWKWIQIIT